MSDMYVPLYEAGNVMKPLTELHSAAALKLSYPDVLEKFMKQFRFHLIRLIHGCGFSKEQGVLLLQGFDKYCIQITHNHHFLLLHQFVIHRCTRQCQLLANMGANTRT